jgi:6-phosphogluconolactonase
MRVSYRVVCISGLENWLFRLFRLLVVIVFAVGSAACSTKMNENDELSDQQDDTRRNIMTQSILYIGGYTQTAEQGIVVYQFNTETGELTLRSVAAGVANPSYLTVSPDKKVLYAVNEIHNYQGQRSGAISAYAIDPDTGDLCFLNQQPSMGVSPCYVTVDATGSIAYLANYSSGTAAVYPIQPDGSLAPASAHVQHEGSGPNTRRQEGPHAHSINLDPTNTYVYVADLGIDKLMIYNVDADAGTLQPNDIPFIDIEPGSGPRHLTFHPTLPYMYLTNEMGNTIMVYAFDASTGNLELLQTVPSLPEGWEGRNTTADIHIEPTGHFLYDSNRGHNSLVTFEIDAKTGLLTLIGHTPTRGKTPRSFVIHPEGRFLLVANQDTNNIVIFSLDPETGALTPTGYEISSYRPVCLKFLILD